ncbi:Helicase conserved C-terminal domain-containing protein [Paenibacillus sp. UNC496MF]|uniref:DEAD/DEAH box helicase family protein n=1 Tax=Paenibacillus sp. UNC496MF TaxID=1502753 RepID=UPI0008E87F94|nr:DEAD/DEAH box helicase family protein [Paenibacillus sp. UNC496MF]SFI70300.1 Helicase conserved C-terminal domain-containing protein [Paenibacillus sp. UNC496MF]
MFFNEESLKSGTWQAFERTVGRLLIHSGFEGVRLVGQSRDRGADLLAQYAGKRWLFQVKHWRQKVGVSVIGETLEALRIYRAQVPVIVSLNGFEAQMQEHQRSLMSRHVPLQLWDSKMLISKAVKLREVPDLNRSPRRYQEQAIQNIIRVYNSGTKRALVVMATGLGKTFVAGETLRRLNAIKPLRVLVIAHTNPLVYQLERAFWPFLNKHQNTVVWNGYEQLSHEQIEGASFVFACLNTVDAFIRNRGELEHFDLIIVDECHHVGGQMYNSIIQELMAGQENGPFLLGLTATPWRPDEVDLNQYFGEPVVSVDIVKGLKQGFLSNVDYRMYTDNINWDSLTRIRGKNFSPRQINRTLFITEWDDAVVYELRSIWNEQKKPRAIVFCGTIDHAITMRDRINALGFCNASAVYSQTVAGRVMEPSERNRILCDFHDGIIDVLCAVDILNEGVDVPDVNIIVFQRVTHSRRIFIQQLGRGLRIADDKDKVIVLDFVSDIRRFAAGINLKDSLHDEEGPAPGSPVRISLQHKVSFRKAGSEDPQTESFIRRWLEDVAEIENAGLDASVLKFPPELPGGRKR